jgi:Rrf2 family protein
LDLQLSRRGDYTLRAAVSLGRNFGGGFRKLREIAEEMAIPFRYTHEIVSLLVKAGLAEALAGKQGGYRLVRDPSTITVLELIEAGEGPLRTTRCALRDGPCHWQDTVCAIHATLEESNRAMTAALRASTHADVIAPDQLLLERSLSEGQR